MRERQKQRMSWGMAASIIISHFRTCIKLRWMQDHHPDLHGLYNKLVQLGFLQVPVQSLLHLIVLSDGKHL